MGEIYVRDEFGRKTVVDQHPVMTTEEVLGLWNSPTGSAAKQLEVIMDKGDEWVGLIANGYLPHQSVWMGLWVQLWDAVKYGIGTNVFTQAEMGRFLHPYIYSIHFCQIWTVIDISRRSGA